MSVNEAVKQLLEIPKTRDLKGEEPGTRKAGNPQAEILVYRQLNLK